MKKIKIGAKNNPLALWQANYTKFCLAEKNVEAELIIFESADKEDTHFSKEIEMAMLRGDLDLAVHNLCELPTTQPEGLIIAGISFREDPADCLLIRQGEATSQLFGLKNGAVVYASTTRRKSQLLGYRPDVQFKKSYSNVPTLLDQLRSGDFDALVMANADLARLRLELDGIEKIKLNIREFTTAPAQGVLAYLCCADDIETRRLVQRQLHEPNISAVTNVERKVLKILGGNTNMSLGVFCERDSSGNYHIWAALADDWNQPVRRVRLSQSTTLGLAEKVVTGLE